MSGFNCGRALKSLARRARSWEPTWRYVYNTIPVVRYQLSRKPLEPEVARIVEALNRDGIAISSIEKLLGADSCFPRLQAEVTRLQREQEGQLAAARAGAADPSSKKQFIVNLLGDRPVLNADDVFVRLAVGTPILGVANAYFGMYTQLRHYNVWHTLKSSGDAVSSQLWHTDRDDLHYVLKAFVNLTPVDQGAGPFTYAPGTHAKGKIHRAPEYLFKEGNTTRSDDAQMAAVVPEDRWVRGEGPPGTIVFADTRGYHKGGNARLSERVLYTCMFTSALAPLPNGKELFERSGPAPVPKERAEAFALGCRPGPLADVHA